MSSIISRAVEEISSVSSSSISFLAASNAASLVTSANSLSFAIIRIPQWKIVALRARTAKSLWVILWALSANAISGA